MGIDLNDGGGGAFTDYQFSPSRRLTGTRTMMRATGTATTAIDLTGTTAKTLTIEGPAK